MTLLTDHQLDILRHMLGINDSTKREATPFRNHYVTGPDDHVLVGLERIGMVQREKSPAWSADGDAWYTCTEAGIAEAVKSFRAIRYPRDKRRYIRWLEISDVLPDLTFGEFLTSKDPDIVEARSTA